MPEYLSPGVYIEEVPSSLKAIEGVSTSTAAFVGRADRGTVPGYVWQGSGTPSLPFTPSGGFVLTPDPAPVLVTSFADFQRQFGPPQSIPLPNDTHDYGYLGWAVRAFFDNGGKRVYIARIVDPYDPSTSRHATPSTVRVAQGVAYRLLRSAAKTDKTVFLTSTRGLVVGDIISFIHHSNGLNALASPVTITAYDSKSNSISFAAQLGAPLDSSDVYGIVTTANPVPNQGPQFIARSAGGWSRNLRVLISNSDGQPTPILGGGVIAAGASKLKVQNVSSFYLGAAVEIDYSGAGRSSHQVTAIDGSTRSITISPVTTNPIDPSATPTPLVRVLQIDVSISDVTGASPAEVYRNLAWNQAPPADVRNHYASAINAGSRLVWVQPPGISLSGSEDFDLTHQPTTLDGFPMSPTTIGDETYDGTDDGTWVGVDNGPGQRSGIESFLDLTDARIIAAPGKTSATIQLALIDQCELLRYRFAVLDGESDPTGGSVTSILSHRSLYDTSFAAYYQPWVTVTVDSQTRYLPSSGYLAGIYARVDNARGVWKAPANEPVLNVIGLKTYFTTGEQDVLNPVGVNLIRKFDIGGILVWGARTLSSDPDFRYINVRRMLIFIEASIDQGTQWVVFEPNTVDTWVRLTDSVSAFLLTQWRSGALFGASPAQAFFVRCDETTMTADDILNGRLICQVGVAIVRPAEFVIFRIEQITNFGAAQ
jgi:phage tail sheath protein FI